MSMHVALAYAFAVVAFVLGSALALRLMTTDDADQKRGQFTYLLIIPGFAGLMYVLMFFDFGNITVGSNTIVLPRYIDWLVTTPVLVGYVGYVAGAPRRWIVGLVTADAAMIVTGAVATVMATPTKWVLFGVSSLFHLSLFFVLYRVLPNFEISSQRRALFKLLQNHVGLLWLAYPLVWLVGTSGLGFVSAAGVSLVVAYLDVVAKVPYIYFVWHRRYVFHSGSGQSESAAGSDRPSETLVSTATN